MLWLLPITKKPTASKPPWTAFIPCLLIASFRTASCCTTQKCHPPSKATAWPQSSHTPRSISPAPIICAWFRCVLTSPASFANTPNIRICFHRPISKEFSPVEFDLYVLAPCTINNQRSQRISHETLCAAGSPLRASRGHHPAFAFPH